MARHYSNTAVQTNLAASISSSAASLSVLSASGYPAAPFTISVTTSNVAEIMLVTAKTTTTFTVTRGYDGTTAAAHNSGDVVRHVIVANDFDTAQSAMQPATYDTNNDGKVNSADSADAVPWAGVTGSTAGVQGVGDTRYGQLAANNSWTATGTHNSPLVATADGTIGGEVGIVGVTASDGSKTLIDGYGDMYLRDKAASSGSVSGNGYTPALNFRSSYWDGSAAQTILAYLYLKRFSATKNDAAARFRVYDPVANTAYNLFEWSLNGQVTIPNVLSAFTTNPSGGIALYSESDTLKYRTPAGTVITLDGTGSGGGTGDMTKATYDTDNDGVLNVAAIPDLDAAKITTGTIPAARLGVSGATPWIRFKNTSTSDVGYQVPGVAWIGTGSTTLAADRTYYYPFTIHSSIGVTGVFKNMTTSGSTLYSSIYSADANGQPVTLQVAFSSAGGTGAGTISGSETTLAAGRYLIAVKVPISTTFSGMQTGVPWFTFNGGVGGVTQMYAASTVASDSFPSSGVAWTATVVDTGTTPRMTYPVLLVVSTNT